jgi:hypothetical protein
LRVNGRDPRKAFHSHRHTASSYLRNALLPDGSPAVKEDMEGICSARRETMFTPGMASNGSKR